jgi:hypothetical protein
MRKTILVFAVAGIFTACSNEKKEETKSTEPAQAAVAMPLPVNYSSSFETGNPAYAAMILQGSWKDWQENKLDKTNWLADTVVAFQSDNTMVMGADSLIARWKRGRALYTSVNDTIDAVLPTYSTDKKENWVLVWAREYNTKTDGTKDTIALMETWRINKDGKADMLLQFDRTKRKQ